MSWISYIARTLFELYRIVTIAAFNGFLLILCGTWYECLTAWDPPVPHAPAQRKIKWKQIQEWHKPEVLWKDEKYKHSERQKFIVCLIQTVNQSELCIFRLSRNIHWHYFVDFILSLFFLMVHLFTFKLMPSPRQCPFAQVAIWNGVDSIRA